MCALGVVEAKPLVIAELVRDATLTHVRKASLGSFQCWEVLLHELLIEELLSQTPDSEARDCAVKTDHEHLQQDNAITGRKDGGQRHDGEGRCGCETEEREREREWDGSAEYVE